jgi:two-component system phosphate regulon response regulator OmpR
MPRILIVEDDSKTRKYTQVFFEREGYKPDWAVSVADAKQKIKLNKYDYIISDVNMPIESGSDLARYLRNSYPEIMVYLTSAVPEIQTNADIYEKNCCDGFIEKPLYPFKFEEKAGLKRKAS